MSFSYNPFQHIDVLHRPHGSYYLYCHGCGKEWGDWTSIVTAKFLFTKMHDHLVSSHRQTPDDFEEWSQT